MKENEALKHLKKLNTLFFKDVEEMKTYLKNNFENVTFEEFLEEEDDGCDSYSLIFQSKYFDYIVYYLYTRNNHVLLVDALPFNK